VTPAQRFGQNLRRVRRALNLSQEALALRAGLHRTEIWMLEKGKRSPGIDTVVKLTGALETDANQLLAGIEWVPVQTGGGVMRVEEDGPPGS
jgi:transcriptional regulator with XRE-family HTH domain